MSATPKSVLFIRPDTFGDIVLFEPVLRALAAAWPNARQTVVVRRGYETLAPLFPRSLIWSSTDLNPFNQDPRDAHEEVQRLLEELAPFQPDLIVAPTFSRTWMEVAIAAHFPKARKVAFGSDDIPLFVKSLNLAFGVNAAEVFKELVPVAADKTDFENNHALCEYLVGKKIDKRAPRLNIPVESRNQANAILQTLGLGEKKWAAVFPAGIANVKIKAWAPSKFAEVTWLGKDGEITILAALLERCYLYFGNDTGAMHIASGVGTPVVGIFGGGHWPRFRPAGDRALAIVEPMPCFGCGWDCCFGDAPCVKNITVEDAKGALEIALSKQNEHFNDVFTVSKLPPTALDLAARVAPIYRRLQSDRLQRQYKIEELTHLGLEKDEAIDEFKAECNIKDAEIGALKHATNIKDIEIASLKKETDVKDGEIDSLKNETNLKDEEIASLKAETNSKDVEIDSLKAEANSKDTEIASLKKAADVKDGEIDQLKDVCNERERLIFKQSGHIKNFQAIVAELNEAHAVKDKKIEVLTLAEARKNELEDCLSKLPEGTLDFAQALHNKQVHIRNIEALVTIRERELVEKNQTIENYRSGHGNLEQAKYYEKLLHDKEGVIQMLNQACTEREALIRQLALQATGVGSRVHKIWTAAKAHMRFKWWQPFDQWLFKKLVEEAVMQVGVLRQHKPQPIKWDKFPKPVLSPNKLPQIGLITPSYCQDKFIESTLLSVLNQKYPKLLYVVQDGGSKDQSTDIIRGYENQLTTWESVKDKGQSDAIRRGFAKIEAKLTQNDVMAWLNSDDLLAPRSLRLVAEYFAKHPEVDVLYGHRIIIDDADKEVGRWVMPRHDPKTLEWIDYVPQETVFWRKRIWDLVGGLDANFQFALDWDLLARFQQANARIVRLPYFLGCFRIHSEQKTNQHIHTTGHDEMTRIRTRFHTTIDHEKIAYYARKARLTGAITARLLALGVRY